MKFFHKFVKICIDMNFLSCINSNRNLESNYIYPFVFLPSLSFCLLTVGKWMDFSNLYLNGLLFQWDNSRATYKIVKRPRGGGERSA